MRFRRSSPKISRNLHRRRKRRLPHRPRAERANRLPPHRRRSPDPTPERRDREGRRPRAARPTSEWRSKCHGERTMTKAELIDDVSHAVDMTRKDSEIIVETIFESIVKSLRTGDKIEIRGFGSFRTRQREARVGRNPKTGARVDVPPKKIPYFKPSKELKDLVNRTPAAVPSAPAEGAATPSSSSSASST